MEKRGHKNDTNFCVKEKQLEENTKQSLGEFLQVFRG